MELVVDGNANSLEYSGKIGGTAAWSENGANGSNEVIAGLKGRAPTAPDNLGCQPSGPRLVGVFSEDGSDLFRGGFIQNCRGGVLRWRPAAARGHPHIEGSPLAEGEAAIFAIDLSRGYSEVKEDPVKVCICQLLDLVEVREVGLVDCEAARFGMSLQPI
jgi:hypothetical protein